ncbi:MAG: TDP-N-acetylfucosamine:lipid II N-acetylfucosaminyltransferase [Alcanivorax sp.]|nr:TDP-N-acetylfucosamine:lipid II N-acetylfucosaminyltransferase [Alcanivorax sp.]
MILHVATVDKFIPPFVDLIKKEFNGGEHVFWLKGDFVRYPVERSGSVHLRGRGGWGKLVAFLRLLFLLHASDKVMIHGMFSPKLVRTLSLCPWLLYKCYWFIWGDDLYQYKSHKKTRRALKNEKRRRFVIRRIGHLVTYIKGDVELARKWYSATGVYHECLMYLSNVVKPENLDSAKKVSTEGRVNVLLGNSAALSNNHFDAMERFLPYRNEDIRIFAPLSYGDKSNVEMVVSRGKDLFGEKFIPITEFVPYDDYLNFLKTIDIGVFNHKRQQAMGNTISLIGMGKTVYMRKDVPQWNFLVSLGLVLKDVENFSMDFIGCEDIDKNKRIVQVFFSRGNLINQLSRIFEG